MESKLEGSYPGSSFESKDQSKAEFYATNTRLKFERVFDSARKAVLAGDAKTALMKYRAARDLLEAGDIYGDSQPALFQLIDELIVRLAENPRDADESHAATG